MSILRINEIKSSSGTTIEIPSSHNLSLDGKILDGTAMPPSTSGQAGKFLKCVGGVASWTAVGPHRMVTFTSSGTYTPDSGVNKILVRLVGGGGSASGVGEGGGAGGYAERLIDITGISSVTVTIGNGNTDSTQYSDAASNGGTTSFGSYLSATGGQGGNQDHRHCGGVGGVGSGGDMNLYGGGGAGHQYYAGPTGGNSFFGGSGPTGYPNAGDYVLDNTASAAFGAGGSPGYHTSIQGGYGKGGLVVVYEFK